MNKEEILNVVAELAQESRLYYTLYNKLTKHGGDDELLSLMETQGFESIFDLRRWVESC